MHRSVVTVFIAVLLQVLILNNFFVRSAWGNSCKYKSKQGYCYMENVSIFKGDEAERFEFPSEKLMVLLAPNILNSGKELLKHVPDTVEKLEIQDGSVPEVYIKNTLTVFKAFRNLVRNVIIDATGPYQLKELTIAQNQLRSVPGNINKLANLEKLYLYENEIETVNMNHFTNLTRLELLALHLNRITNIDTSAPLRLPNLAKVVLHSNRIKNLSVKLWNFPSLKRINLQQNMLRKIDSFWGHFPKLTETYFAQNQWSCAWLEQTLPPILKAGKITVHGGGETCPEKSVEGFCCSDSLEDVNNALIKSIADQFKEVSATLERAVQQIEGKISKLDNKLDRTNQQLKAINVRVNENRALIGDVLNEKSKEIYALKTVMNSNVQIIKEEVKSVELQFSSKVGENRVMIENDKHTLEKKIGEMKTDIDRNVQTLEKKIGEMKIDIDRNVLDIKEDIKTTESVARKQVESEFREVNAKINESLTLLEEDRKKFEIIDEDQKQLEQIVVDLHSDMEHSVQATKEEIDSIKSSTRRQAYEHALLQEKVGDLKSDFDKQLYQTKNEFEWVKEKLNENRALIDDVVEDLYLEELEKQEL